MDAGENDVLDADAAGQYLGLHPETVRRFAREKKIPAYKVGGRWRFNRSFLYRWAERQQAGEETKRVLIVDDERAIRVTVGRSLEHDGYETATAASGREALQRMAEKVPDVVILDLKLPDISGAEVLRQIRENYGDLPVLVITGYPDSHLVTDALEHAPFTILAKPVTSGKLFETVRMIVGGRTRGTSAERAGQ